MFCSYVDGMYIQCSAVVLHPGTSSQEGAPGGVDDGRFMTSKLNSDSLQTSPIWTDEATVGVDYNLFSIPTTCAHLEILQPINCILMNDWRGCT